jgi:predicted metal-dependent phosphoesterase TrpH
MLIHYDLHSHSTASDGALAPAELVRVASAAGVDVLALTDHDSTAGLGEARVAAAAIGIELINGIEISVTWNAHTVHIVGLNLDPGNAALQAGLDGLLAFRAWRAEEIDRRLAKQGIAGALDGARAFAQGKLLSRTHFARFLVQRHLAKDERDVFKHYLVNGKPGYVPGQWAELSAAVDWINGAGGQAVIAHPARYKMTRGKLRRLIDEFVRAGGSGLEVISGSYNKDEAFTMARHARDFGLRASVGSDFHNPANTWNVLGRLPALPQECVPIWRDWNLTAFCAKACSVA